LGPPVTVRGHGLPVDLGEAPLDLTFPASLELNAVGRRDSEKFWCRRLENKHALDFIFNEKGGNLKKAVLAEADSYPDVVKILGPPESSFARLGDGGALHLWRVCNGRLGKGFRAFNVIAKTNREGQIVYLYFTKGRPASGKGPADPWVRREQQGAAGSDRAAVRE